MKKGYLISFDDYLTTLYKDKIILTKINFYIFKKKKKKKKK